MTEPQVLIPRALAQAVVDYLSKRPYSEVAQLIAGLSRARLANVVAEETPAAPALLKREETP